MMFLIIVFLPLIVAVSQRSPTKYILSLYSIYRDQIKLTTEGRLIHIIHMVYTFLLPVDSKRPATESVTDDDAGKK